MRVGRRGGRGSAAGRGGRWRAVRPAAAAGVERVSSAAVALPCFILSDGQRCSSLLFFFSASPLAPCSSSIPPFKQSYSTCRKFDRRYGHP
jgi:hypothetical protein